MKLTAAIKPCEMTMQVALREIPSLKIASRPVEVTVRTEGFDWNSLSLEMTKYLENLPATIKTISDYAIGISRLPVMFYSETGSLKFSPAPADMGHIRLQIIGGEDVGQVGVSWRNDLRSFQYDTSIDAGADAEIILVLPEQSESLNVRKIERSLLISLGRTILSEYRQTHLLDASVSVAMFTNEADAIVKEIQSLQNNLNYFLFDTIASNEAALFGHMLALSYSFKHGLDTKGIRESLKAKHMFLSSAEFLLNRLERQPQILHRNVFSALNYAVEVVLRKHENVLKNYKLDIIPRALVLKSQNFRNLSSFEKTELLRELEEMRQTVRTKVEQAKSAEIAVVDAEVEELLKSMRP